MENNNYMYMKIKLLKVIKKLQIENEQLKLQLGIK